MLPHLDEVVALVRTAADEELAGRFRATSRALKADGTFVTEADVAMQRRLHQELTQRWPHYLFLGEEMEEAEQQRLMDAGRGLWCLDPLDGTSNFAAGLPFFSASLALIVEGEVVLGVVYDPMRRECFSAQRGAGAWCDGARLQTRPAGVTLAQSIAVIDFKRLPSELTTRLASQPPYSSQRSFGSVALDWCWLAAGRFHVYLHGRQGLWDYAAGCLILAEAGGHAVALDGEPVYRGSLARRSVAAALDGEMFKAWRDWLGI